MQTDCLSVQMKSTKWSANLSHMQKKGCHGYTVVLTTLVLIFCAQYYMMLNNCTTTEYCEANNLTTSHMFLMIVKQSADCKYRIEDYSMYTIYFSGEADPSAMQSQPESHHA